MVRLSDGAGGGHEARVDTGHRLATRAVNETETLEATSEGDAYNLNTGVFSVAGDSALLYMKNTGTRAIVLESVALGIGSAASLSDSARVTLIRNPTMGSIVTGASGVDMNQNRNHGTNNTLTADVYKGGNLATFTDGDDAALFFSGTGRLFATINFEVDPGNSVGLKLDPQLSSGSANVYAAFIVYLKPNQGST